MPTQSRISIRKCSIAKSGPNVASSQEGASNWVLIRWARVNNIANCIFVLINASIYEINIQSIINNKQKSDKNIFYHVLSSVPC